MTRPAPIILFAYNRPIHTKNTIEALKKNLLASESELYIFSDAPKNAEAAPLVAEVREYLATIEGFAAVHIITREKNFGLGKNIIDGVTNIIGQKGKVIVLEDDLITAPWFLQYMNEGLTIYQDDPSVISIHGYLYPVKGEMPQTFFIKNADCLGWGTWTRGWDLFQTDGQKLLDRIQATNAAHEFDFDGAYPYTRMLQEQIAGINSSWAIRWYATAFLHNMYTLYPGKSLVYHAGNDGSGVNTGFDSILDTELSQGPIQVERIPVQQYEPAYAEFRKVLHTLAYPPLMYRIKRKIKNLIARK